MFVYAGQFDGGDPLPSHRQQQYNQQPLTNQHYSYDQQYSNQDQYNQWGYPQQFGGGQDQRWHQHQAIGDLGPGGRHSNQYNAEPLYQNVPGHRGGDQYGKGGGQFRDQTGHQFEEGRAPYNGGGASYAGSRASYGRNQGPYNRINPGIKQEQHGGMQYGVHEVYQQGGPPGHGVQNVSHRPKEAWSDKQDTRNNQPWDISMCDHAEMHT